VNIRGLAGGLTIAVSECEIKFPGRTKEVPDRVGGKAYEGKVGRPRRSDVEQNDDEDTCPSRVLVAAPIPRAGYSDTNKAMDRGISVHPRSSGTICVFATEFK
jgi:hypothetical protein